MSATSARLRAVVAGFVLMVCIGFGAFSVRHHRIDWFIDDLIAAIASRDAAAVSQLTSPTSAELISAKYGEYLALMVESRDGYYVLGSNPRVTAIEETPITDALRKHWFGYLPDPHHIRAFQITLPGATITVYATRTLGGWRQVIQDPSDNFKAPPNNP